MATLSYLTTTHFDFGAVGRTGKEMARLGLKRPLIVTDAGVRGAGLVDKVTQAIENGIDLPVYDGTPPNPTEKATLEAFELYQAEGCDGIIALGGGSPMDLGKGVALLAGSGEPLEKFDPLTKGHRNIKTLSPLIAIPTTSGTGSEVSLGAVIILNDGRKVTFASPLLIPPVAICDPELTLGLPPMMTAATGMDAITHCIESVLSPTVNPPADGVGLDGLWRGWQNLKKAVQDGSDREARWQMMMASTEGAFAFIKGLGGVHSMSHAVGRRADLRAHHGTLNAILLPALLRFNEDVAQPHYVRLRQAMGLGEGADLAKAVEDMNAAIGLPAKLSALGVSPDMIEDLVPHAVSDLATRTNIRPVTAQDYARLYEEVL